MELMGLWEGSGPYQLTPQQGQSKRGLENVIFQGRRAETLLRSKRSPYQMAEHFLTDSIYSKDRSFTFEEISYQHL